MSNFSVLCAALAVVDPVAEQAVSADAVDRWLTVVVEFKIKWIRRGCRPALVATKVCWQRNATPGTLGSAMNDLWEQAIKDIIDGAYFRIQKILGGGDAFDDQIID